MVKKKKKRPVKKSPQYAIKCMCSNCDSWVSTTWKNPPISCPWPDDPYYAMFITEIGLGDEDDRLLFRSQAAALLVADALRSEIRAREKPKRAPKTRKSKGDLPVDPFFDLFRGRFEVREV